MIKPPDCFKHYHSAKQRFLKGLLLNFFDRELPKLFGPTLRQKLADEIIKLVVTAMPEKEHVQPGQIVWNAIDLRTRSASTRRAAIHARFWLNYLVRRLACNETTKSLLNKTSNDFASYRQFA